MSYAQECFIPFFVDMIACDAYIPGAISLANAFVIFCNLQKENNDRVDRCVCLSIALLGVPQDVFFVCRGPEMH